MGKKIAIGCLVVFGVLAVAGGVIAYIYVIRPASAAVDTARNLARIQSLNEEVRATGPYDAPADDVLAPAQVERYLAVQEDMRAQLEGRVAELEARYEQFDQAGTDPSLSDVTQAWSDVASLLVEAKEAQVEALNAHDFSLDEYDWVRARVLQAAGVGAYGYDLAQLASRAEGEGQVSDPEGDTPDTVPEENVELVDPHRDTIRDTLAFAMFGL